MEPSQNKARNSVAHYRARRARAGFVRVEISVHREDVDLLRAVAAALSDPARHGDAREVLTKNFSRAKPDLKQLLASAPLEGIELERPSDFGRPVDI